MDFSQYLSNISLDRISKTLEESHTQKGAKGYIDYVLSLDDDMKVLLITRGMMYICVELEFDFEGEDIWEACAFYDKVVNSDDDPTGLGYHS